MRKYTSYVLYAVAGCFAQEKTAVSVCDVLANPERFEQKIVTVRGDLWVHPESRTLNPAGCRIQRKPYADLEASIWLTSMGRGRTENAKVKPEANLFEQFNTIVKRYGMPTEIIAGLTPPDPQAPPPLPRPAIVDVRGWLMCSPPRLTYAPSHIGYGQPGIFPCQIVMESIRESALPVAK